MRYADFKDTYKYMLKKFPETSNLFEEEPKKNIKATIINYEKVGNRWKETDRTTEEVDFIYYSRVIDAIPFFKNLGGREIVTQTYTKKGYLPTEINSISPTKDQKTLRIFKF